MKIEKVLFSIEDGTMDCVGGVRTEYLPLLYKDTDVFNIKATTDGHNVNISLTGYELDNLVSILRRRI